MVRVAERSFSSGEFEIFGWLGYSWVMKSEIKVYCGIYITHLLGRY